MTPGDLYIIQKPGLRLWSPKSGLSIAEVDSKVLIKSIYRGLSEPAYASLVLLDAQGQSWAVDLYEFVSAAVQEI